MTNFYSRSFRRPTIPAPECFKDSPAYELRRDPNAKDSYRLFEKATRIPTYDMIQEAKGPTLKEIVNRALLGDYSLIGQTKATFQDFTKAPKSLREVQDLLRDSTTNFENLPVIFKEAFNNNVDYFRTCVQNGKVDEIVSNVVSKNIKKFTKEVKGEPVNESKSE